jgi:hypothetical protein
MISLHPGNATIIDEFFYMNHQELLKSGNITVAVIEIPVDTHAEVGLNTFILTLRVVGGHKKAPRRLGV